MRPIDTSHVGILRKLWQTVGSGSQGYQHTTEQTQDTKHSSANRQIRTCHAQRFPSTYGRLCIGIICIIVIIATIACAKAAAENHQIGLTPTSKQNWKDRKSYQETRRSIGRSASRMATVLAKGPAKFSHGTTEMYAIPTTCSHRIDRVAHRAAYSFACIVERDTIRLTNAVKYACDPDPSCIRSACSCWSHESESGIGKSPRCPDDAFRKCGARIPDARCDGSVSVTHFAIANHHLRQTSTCLPRYHRWFHCPMWEPQSMLPSNHHQEIGIHQ